jgi:hypothetical protein
MAEKKAKVAVDVVDKEGAVVRTYTAKQHGKDFKDLADEFAGKVEGRKVVASDNADEEDEKVVASDNADEEDEDEDK